MTTLSVTLDANKTITLKYTKAVVEIETLLDIIKDKTAGRITGEEAIKRCYRTVLDRESDAAGLQAHLAYLTSTGSIIKVVVGFVQGAEAEFNSRWPEGWAKDNTLLGIIQDQMGRLITGEEAIKRCYRTVLDRESDAAGLQSHLAYLTSTGSIIKVVIGFVQGAEAEFNSRKSEA